MVDADNHSVGVLIDLDIAVRLRHPQSKQPLPFKPVPGGTLPFRAIDVRTDSDDEVQTLYYRHDLESFFWTLLWISAYHPFHSSVPVKDFSAWTRGGPYGISSLKRGMLLYMARGHELPEGPLKTTWLQRLAILFNNGYDRLMEAAVDRETMGGTISYESFMSPLVENVNQ